MEAIGVSLGAGRWLEATGVPRSTEVGGDGVAGVVLQLVPPVVLVVLDRVGGAVSW